jgi:hypothetical protein
VKVRIGYGLGTRTTLHDERFGHVVDELERRRFDSLWVSERIGGDAPDPLVAMAYAAGRTTHLKFGMSVMVLPGRNPIVLAKALATLATMSGGRLLPAFGLGQVHPLEQQAFGVDRAEFVESGRSWCSPSTSQQPQPPGRPTSPTGVLRPDRPRQDAASRGSWSGSAGSPRRGRCRALTDLRFHRANSCGSTQRATGR